MIPERPERARARGRRIKLLPHMITLANAGCGFLAISKSIDALALSRSDPDIFFWKMSTACWLVVLAMVFDALDGKIARMTGSASEYGSQLDSFADFLTFGCAPALLAKVLLEHEGLEVGYHGFPRLHFVAAAVFAIMALLRLVRFNLETGLDEESHKGFAGLPSPAAAGAVISTMLFYLALRRPEIEGDEGTPTPLSGLLAFVRDRAPGLHAGLPGWILPALVIMLVGLGVLMVSRVPYPHMAAALLRPRHPFTTLVGVVFLAFALFVAPVPFLFIGFNAYVIAGLVQVLRARRGARKGPRGPSGPGDSGGAEPRALSAPGDPWSSEAGHTASGSRP